MAIRVVHGAAVPAAVAELLAGGDSIAVVSEVDVPPQAWDLAHTPFAPDAGVLIGTSGSTGAPKGVLLGVAAVRAAATAAQRRLGGPGNWVCSLPLHYVAGLMTAARAAVAGAELSVVPSDLSVLPLRAGRNYLSVVVAQLHAALADPAKVAGLAGFDAVLVGGSAVPAALLERGRAAGISLVTSYGMAETCGGCVYDGDPLDGVRIGIAAGDRIEVSADLVFSGYRLDPEGTAAALRTGADGVRTFGSHDRGRWLDGRLQVLGRLDEVVISGGVNVDLSEAQRVLDAAFGPGTVALLGVPDERWGTRIVAVSELGVTLTDCRVKLAGRLAPAAIPRQLRRVAGLPRTSTGKIDRRGLWQAWTDGTEGN